MSRAILPDACRVCVFHHEQPERCRRHAPAPGEEAHELVHWPKVQPEDRCGDGEPYGESEFTVVRCGQCRHWLRPGDVPLSPPFRQGKPVEWWEQAGYCTRFAPTPSTDEPRRPVQWRVTHAAEWCGDAEDAEAEG